jgi:hypothetical protein
MVGHLNVSLKDHIHLINQTSLDTVLEGIEPRTHFKHDQAETIPVYTVAVVLVFYNFGSEILSGTTEAFCQTVMFFKATFA